MQKVKRITSEQQNGYIDIVGQDNRYTLEFYVEMYDEEEGVYYTVRQFDSTHSGSIYGSVKLAANEAERLMQLEYFK